MPIDDDTLKALLPPTEDAPGPELAAGSTSDGLRFAGLDVAGDATDARFLECVFTGCDLAGVAFDRARLSTSLFTDLRSPAWSLVDATLLDVVVAGGRFGALTASGARLTRVAL